MPVSNTTQKAEIIVNKYLFNGAGKPIGISVLDGPKLPQNARVKRAWYEVTSPFSSAINLATVSLGIETDAPTGLLSSTLVSNSLFNSTGAKDTLATGLANSFSVKTTGQRNIIATVGVQALTDGNLTLFVEYYTA